MFTVQGRLTLKQVVEGFREIWKEFLGQSQRSKEGLLVAERDRRIAQLRQQGEKVYRWGYTGRKGWSRAAGWGAPEAGTSAPAASTQRRASSSSAVSSWRANRPVPEEFTVTRSTLQSAFNSKARQWPSRLPA